MMVGERLRTIRNSKSLSLEEVTKATGITNSRLSKIERGITEHPSLDDISTLLNFYGIPLISFLSKEGYCQKDSTLLNNLELLNNFELEHLQAEIDFIMKEKGLNNGI